MRDLYLFLFCLAWVIVVIAIIALFALDQTLEQKEHRLSRGASATIILSIAYLIFYFVK